MVDLQLNAVDRLRGCLDSNATLEDALSLPVLSFHEIRAFLWFLARPNNVLAVQGFKTGYLSTTSELGKLTALARARRSTYSNDDCLRTLNFFKQVLKTFILMLLTRTQ
ncbi:hypothetical protein Ae201684_018804 [Aphanomyces euteiches]|uniref:Uncharacterized protein n=1 Tax=Aphanomyces euteiches TaxID=100861 RepID=A0A6G0W639_9STRA|nr:hypothetical protein Ae201684_018804 [Aphanomyces euteiches]